MRGDCTEREEAESESQRRIMARECECHVRARLLPKKAPGLSQEAAVGNQVFAMSSHHPNKSPITSILLSPTSYLLCELTVDGRAADCALCRDVIQSACRACLGNVGTGLASMSVVKQCSASVFIVSVASSHLSEVWAAMTIASSFEKRGTSKLH